MNILTPAQLPVARVPVILDLARILNVEPSDLTGGFLRGTQDGGPITEHPAVPAIRRVLSLPTSLLGGRVGTPLSPQEFDDAVAAARTVYDTQKLRYTVVGDELLLEQGYAMLRAAALRTVSTSVTRAVRTSAPFR